MRVFLECHASTPAVAVRRIQASVSRSANSLSVSYVVEGDIAQLRIPPPGVQRIAGRLWQHTCCEIFIARRGLPAYHEFNFAPSGEWAGYGFERYREGAAPNEEAINPRIRVQRAAGRLEVDATIRLDRLQLAQPALSVGLCAVIEDARGSLSYWALKHPPGKPDFHQRDAFALELDEARH